MKVGFDNGRSPRPPLFVVQDGPVQPTQSDQLKFYGLYKQATIGDVNTSRPGMMGE